MSMNTLVQAWSKLDKLYYALTRLQYINQEQNIFRVKLLPYRGESIHLSDGTVISHKDLLIKIHLHNCVLLNEMKGIKNEVERAYYVYHRVEQSLPELAQYILTHPEKDKIKGIIGITLLHRGVKRLGFEVREIGNPFYRLLKSLYLIPMFLICHPNSGTSNSKKQHLVPKYLLMSKEKLIDKYTSK